MIQENEIQGPYTMVPDYILSLGLSPYAFTLYVHLRAMARGDRTGWHWKSTRALAQECNMSIGEVSQAKRELETAGLIERQLRIPEGGQRPCDFIRIRR
ncbi:hypothetical protein DRH14_05150 [Candidatus Shapirobacteria bacterium]|nr:MAG: hypothetical protein DRH14_05150 [Candidatus Shapirobacteria bacterium]